MIESTRPYPQPKPCVTPDCKGYQYTSLHSYCPDCRRKHPDLETIPRGLTDKQVRAAQLRSEGKLLREIGVLLGVTRQRAQKLVSEAARKKGKATK